MSEQQQQGLSSLPAVYSRLIAEPGSQQASQHSKQSEWIWEYVLKNCNDYQITTKLLEAIPIPDTPLIKKLALLKLLTLDSAAATLFDRDLFALEGFQEIAQEPELGEIIPELLLLVKAELALQHIRGSHDDMASFNAVVERHWGEMVPDTQASDSIEELRSGLRCDLWSVRSNPRLRGYVEGLYKRERVEEVMKRFLELAWKSVGPVFLERAEDDILHGRYVPSGAPVAGDGDGDRVGVGDSGHHPDVTQRKKKRIRKTLLPSLDDQPAGAEDSPAAPPPWIEENVKHDKRKLRRINADDDEAKEEEAKKKEEAKQSPLVERVLNELKESQLNLKQHVVDPLPEAIQVARNLTKERDGDAAEPQQQQQQQQNNDENGSKAKLTDRNPTARTHQWEDDEDEIETSGQEHSPSDSKRVNLPSTSARRVSPLRTIEPVKNSGHNRRKFTRWTPTEEEALRRGVEQYGKGRWKAILQSYTEVFQNRTEVDLKDKWRNIEKAEGIKR